MKKGLLLSLLVLMGAASSLAQFSQATIRQIQQVPLDSLLVADQLQRSFNSRWTIQTSPLFKATGFRDTVTVVGVCVVPAKVINFTSIGYNLLIADTGSPNIWGALFVRPNISNSTNPGDTAKAIQWGALNVQEGDLIKVSGYIDEFPATDMVSYTQLVPNYDRPIEILGTAPVPKHLPKQVADFYQGVFPGSIRFSTGEPYEMMRVELTNLTVTSYLSTTNGTFNMVDAEGNQISTMDASKWFTTRGHRDPASTYALPSINTKVDTIRGYILTNSGQDAALGYRIAPLYPGDIKYGAILPLISTHRRNPVVVPPDSAARVSVRVTKQTGGSGLASVTLRYGLDNGAFSSLPMAYQAADSSYLATIPRQANNTFVRYYIEVQDSAGEKVRLASSAVGGAGSDTSKGFFFYTSMNRPLTIRDIQYTPYANGRTPYLGAVTSVAGVVTVDTTQIGLSPLNTAGTNAWYIQDGNQPWSGLWIVATDTVARRQLAALRAGDSVIVTGTVTENFDVTQLSNVQAGVVVAAAGRPAPGPVVLPTGNFPPQSGNGLPLAEPYEGMLVRFNNVTVANVYPTFSDPTEFTVDGGTGPVLVRRDGTHSFTNVPADTAFGKTLLREGDKIAFLTGVMYYSFNSYKLTPRTNADFGAITVGVEDQQGDVIPGSFALDQNYPNPFNPSTLIAYGLPRSGYVTLKVYNILGQEVRTLVSASQGAGRYTVRFDASSLATGLYLYRIHVVPESGAEFSVVKKMVLMK